jgi:hypothetical protein
MRSGLRDAQALAKWGRRGAKSGSCRDISSRRPYQKTRARNGRPLVMLARPRGRRAPFVLTSIPLYLTLPDVYLLRGWALWGGDRTVAGSVSGWFCTTPPAVSACGSKHFRHRAAGFASLFFSGGISARPRKFFQDRGMQDTRDCVNSPHSTANSPSVPATLGAGRSG